MGSVVHVVVVCCCPDFLWADGVGLVVGELCRRLKATLLTHVEQKVSRVREYLRVVPFYGDGHSFNVNLLFPSTLRRVFGSDRWIDKYY